MMFFLRYVLGIILCSTVICSPRINMVRTDSISDSHTQQHCLDVLASTKKEMTSHEVISYCLSESSSQWHLKENNVDQKFTFVQLHQQQVTSEQLYFWSASIDVIERYQLYLNQLKTDYPSRSMSSQLFYNCTWPRFGSFCQYSFDIEQYGHHSSLNEMISEYYIDKYAPTSLTCYTHLECNRGSILICLDWSEICDRTVDCQNGVDEEFCWELYDHVCENDAHQCANGQCIDRIFLNDDPATSECLDQSEESKNYLTTYVLFFANFDGEPTFTSEDISCPIRHEKFKAKLTSSCFLGRHTMLRDLLFSETPKLASDDCWLTVQCQLNLRSVYSERCWNFDLGKRNMISVNESCPEHIKIPAGTLAWGHVFFVYRKESLLKVKSRLLPSPDYVCYNEQLCDAFDPNTAVIRFDNATCRHPEDIPLLFDLVLGNRRSWYDMYVTPIFNQMHHCNRISYDDLRNCNNSTMYKCLNSSKCISKHQLCNRIDDCRYGDDEKCTPVNGSCALYGLNTLTLCVIWNFCMLSTMTEKSFCHDTSLDIGYIQNHISFTTICDGFTELVPIIIDGRSETDETGCEYWQCNNTYTRCDGLWNCLDGADEVACDSPSLLSCPLHHHVCISPATNQFMCLPLTKANDGVVDCLGGTDETRLCRPSGHKYTNKNFYCINDKGATCISNLELCYMNYCEDGSDMQFCQTFTNGTAVRGICWFQNNGTRSDVENFFCKRRADNTKAQIVPFTIHQRIDLIDHHVEQQTNTIISSSSSSSNHQSLCHRGLLVQVWSHVNRTSSNITCLCPPSFYGDRCQYQNQRVTLTLKFQAFSYSRRTLFAILVTLIDNTDQRIIHSSQQLTYLYAKHCPIKYNIYLLYFNRPKLPGRNYSIHIDTYEKDSLIYRGSLTIPIKFDFLPVYRTAVQVDIPKIDTSIEICTTMNCVHGRCHTYLNDPNEKPFCQCDQGWSGRYCHIPYNCTCSFDSWCAGIDANNRSICICPRNKWGSRCLLQSAFCQSGPDPTCRNNGECIPVDENIASKKQFICVCRKGYSGERCEIVDKTLVIVFHEHIPLPQSVLIHFFRLNGNKPLNFGSTYRTILTNQRFVAFPWSQPFHIAAVEILNDSYYLIAAQQTYNRSMILTKMIHPSDRCAHLREVFNQTIINLHLLRRIKYYHLPCQNQSAQLSCFFDNTHFCLCNDFGQHRVANCFEFNASRKHDCFGHSSCENDAHCLQDKPTCPETSVCVCPQCFYGVKCQFSSNLLSVSLDAILGHHIQPHLRVKDQPTIIQVTIALTVFVCVIGLINGLLSLVTFIKKEPRKTACGVYLFASSITSLVVTTIFVVKISILLATQMTYVTNRTFLYLQCMSLDFLLDLSLYIDQWLGVCVALERALTIMKGSRYNQGASRRTAKYVIGILIIVLVSTTLYDPIYRRLLEVNENDLEEKRIWCIVRLSAGFRTYSAFISMFNPLASFTLNIVSAIIIIVMTARRRRTVLRTHEAYRKIFYEQFQQHKHLLTGPVILIVLAIPRLIISFAGSCMKSTRDSWLFLFGYFISIVPSTVTFLIFVLPSSSYKEVFRMTVKQYRQRIQS